MIKVADALNSFASEQGGFVQTDEQVYILTGSQLQQVIQKATEPLQEEINRLWLSYDKLALDAAHNNQRVKKLEYKEPQPKQRDRSEILRALIAAYGGKMPEKFARQKMGLSKQTFSMLIATMNDHVEITPLQHDKRKKLLILK